MEPAVHYGSAVTASVVVDSPDLCFRLALKPRRAAKGFFDGGWWPRSADPVVEFSALVRALVEQRGLVHRIGFGLRAWDMAPGRLVAPHGIVRLQGFHALNGYTVIAIGPVIRRLTLLMVPAGTDPETANRALTLASAPLNVDNADQIFAACHVPGPDIAMGEPG